MSVATLLVVCGCRGTSALPPGTEFYSVAKEAVLGVSVQSGTRRADAHRFAGESAFTFAFEHIGGHFERCAQSDRLDHALEAVLSLRAVDVLDETRARTELGRGSDAVDLEIRDIGPPEEWLHIRLFKHSSKKLLFGRWLDDTVLLEPSVVSLLEMGCAAQ